MIKGLTKTVVLMKCEKDSMFEEALFFLRVPESLNDIGMVEAANKLIGIADKEKRREGKIKKKLAFVITFVLGVGVGVFIAFLSSSIN